jgi:GAF domain-containing protein
MDVDLARLIVRHRHVAPMLSALLGGTNAAVRIRDADDTVLLERQPAEVGSKRFPIAVEGVTVGWVEGDRMARAIASVISYAAAREADKRSLAREALERYRELNLVYELAEALGGVSEPVAVAEAALAEVNRIPGGGVGFVLIGDTASGGLTTPDRVLPGPIEAVAIGEGIVGGVATGEPEIVNDVAADPRVVDAERGVASLLVAPLRARGEPIGVIGAATTEGHEYRSGDLKVLAAIAALTGPALDQARSRQAAARAGVG